MSNTVTAAAKTFAIGPKYTAHVEESKHYGHVIVLVGKRGARYRSIPNRHDGFHRFIDAPVAKVVLALDSNGTVCLPREAK